LNFFGHAVVAAWTDDHPEHLLGSMLPDFEAMVRVPMVEVRDPVIRRGVDVHHRTDQVFHRSSAFVALCARAMSRMLELGIRRGTSRAVAHIGTELFLDGWLTREPRHVDTYLAALEIDARNRVCWEDEGAAFERLQARLCAWGAPRGYEEPEFVLARLTDSLARRPALALRDGESVRVATFLPSLQRMVERSASELLAQIRSGLGVGH
jgi:hypothetical protein